MAAIPFVFFTIMVLGVASMKLEQVLILSRHNIRAPLSKNLQKTSPLEWPSWDVPATYLTDKGRILEECMGEYFSLWFITNGLFGNACPSKDSVFIYANKKQRTIETAKAFAKGAFKTCDIDVHYLIDDVPERFDPLFAPILRNKTDSFKNSFYRETKEKLNNLRLFDAFSTLAKIIDIKNSNICRNEQICDFDLKKNEILYEIGEEPDTYGPLSLGNSIVDFFLMCYYNGMPKEKIAWGKIDTEEKWSQLLQITKEDQNVRFNQSSYIATEVGRPLLEFLRDSFLEKDKVRKLTILVGHDSNLNNLIAALRIKKYELNGQFELTPIGGKIVFQKWKNSEAQEFLKIEYFYESMKQLRNGTKISKEKPPFTKVLEIDNCKINDEGFCSWNEFVNVLQNLIK